MSSKTKTTATKEEATPALVPKLRFPEFRDSDDWQTKLLGGLCKIRTGKKDANEGASDGQYPFFTCAENHIFSHSYSFDAEAILIAGNANVGQTRYYSGKFEAYQRTYVLTDFSGISVPYLYAVLNAKLRESLLAHVQVSAMSYIKLPMLQEYALAVPPSPAEQQKIAECLSSVDELMAAQARKVDALKTHKKGLMQQLFPREGETVPRLRFPEFKNTGEWVTDGLGEVANFVNEKILLECVSLENYVSTENILPAYGGVARASKLPTTGSVTRYRPDDTLVSNIRPYLKKVWVADREGGASNDVIVIRAKQRLLPQYVSCLLKNDAFIDYVMTGAKGVKMPRGDIGSMKVYPILYPSKPEQQRIASCLTTLDDLINVQTQKIEALKNHKKGLMQGLFPSLEVRTTL